MIKDPERLKKLEDAYIRRERKPDFGRSSKLFADMWKEGLNLGVLPLKEPLEGIDTDIRIAKALNSCLKKSSRG
jgi:hypothetical protein